MNLKYKHCPKGEVPIIALGREVTTYNSPMKYYDTQYGRFTITCPANLPMVNLFIALMTSRYNYDGAL
jgi:hypothetical protein